MQHSDYLPLTLVLALGCTPRSIGLGDDSGDDGDAASSSELADDTGDDEPTTAGSESAGSELHDGVGAVDLAVGADGSIVVIGQSGYLSDPYVNYNLVTEGFSNDWIGKFDAAGELLWVHETPVPDIGYSPVAVAVAVAPDGAAYVAWNDRLQKLDPAGATLWTRPLPEDPHGLATSADGRVIVASEQFIDLAHVPFVQVFDSEGAAVWEQIYDRPEYHDQDTDTPRVTGVAVDDGDGTVVLLGALGVDHEVDPSVQIWLMRADLDTGALHWHQSIGDAFIGHRNGRELGITADGTTLVLVYGAEIELKAFSRAGDPLWSLSPTVAGSLSVAPDGSFALAGTHYVEYPQGNHPLERCDPSVACPDGTRVARYAADHTLLWSQSNDTCKSGVQVAVGPGDGVVVLGQCSQPPYGPYAMSLLHYAP